MRYLSALIEPFELRADEPYLLEAEGDRRLTYGEALRIAGGVAGELRARGFGPGELLALGMANSLELAVVCLGALLEGVTVMPLAASFGRRELRSILERSRPRLFLGDQRHPASLLAAELGLDVVSDGDPISRPLALEADPSWFAFDGVTSTSIASIHFTSGSTGEPRAVAHRIRDFVANAERFTQATGLRPSDRFYATLPMLYMAGYYNLLLLPTVLGASVVIAPSFDAKSVISYWRGAKRHRANVLWLVPTIMAMLMRVDRGEDGPSFCREHVRFAASGTAPLDPDLRTAFEQRYGVTIHESYGLSETLLATSSTPEDPARPGTVGKPLPGITIEIVDEAAGPVSNGTTGQVLIRSPDTATGAGGADGWLPTGDIGAFDADGALRITGRTKDIVIRGGVNVSAVHVERSLRGVSGVEDVAVVGVPHDLLGEEIAAVVVCATGGSLEDVEPQLRARAADQLPQSQRPGAYVEIDALPLTPSGKVRKGTLRAMVIDRLGLAASSKQFVVDRAGPSVTATDLGTVIDLSHPLREGMTSFPSANHVRPEITILGRHQVEGRATRRIVLGSHTGTHADAPLHFLVGGASIDQLEPAVFVGPAQVVDLTPVAALQEIDRERLRLAAGGRLRHPRVLLRFDWSGRFDEGLEFYSQSPFLGMAACEWLIDQGVRLIGMDIPSPDDPRNGFGSDVDSPNHHLLLGAGVVLLEYLTNLDQIPPDVFLSAAPLPVVGSDGAPLRALAVIHDA